MMKVTRAVAVLLVLALAAAAQSAPQNWNNVKAITAGTEVRVNVGTRRVTGQFQSAMDDALVINSRTGQETLTRQEVLRVSVKKQGKRARNTLLGLGIGAGAGLGIGAIADARAAACDGFICLKGLGKFAGTIIGAILGLATGALIPTGGWHEVYKQ
jgi:hypothetical protein